MFSKQNPPKEKNHLCPVREIVQLYDFAYDKDHNLIVVESEKVNYSKMAAAAAEGCDFQAIKDTLRAGSVRLSKAVFTNTPGKGVEYGVENEPGSLIELDQAVKNAAAAAKESYAKIPDEVRNGMTLDQFSKAVDSGYLEKYIKMKEAQTKVLGEVKDAK